MIRYVYMIFRLAMSEKKLAETAHCIPEVLCQGSPFHGPSARLVSTLISLILYINIISSPAVFAVSLCLSRFSVVWEALFRNTCDKQQKPQRFWLVAACLHDNLELLFVHHMIQIHHFKTFIQAISWANYLDLHEFRSWRGDTSIPRNGNHSAPKKRPIRVETSAWRQAPKHHQIHPTISPFEVCWTADMDPKIPGYFSFSAIYDNIGYILSS